MLYIMHVIGFFILVLVLTM